jgi:hypothetical protein
MIERMFSENKICPKITTTNPVRDLPGCHDIVEGPVIQGEQLKRTENFTQGHFSLLQ